MRSLFWSNDMDGFLLVAQDSRLVAQHREVIQRLERHEEMLRKILLSQDCSVSKTFSQQSMKSRRRSSAGIRNLVGFIPFVSFGWQVFESLDDHLVPSKLNFVVHVMLFLQGIHVHKGENRCFLYRDVANLTTFLFQGILEVWKPCRSLQASQRSNHLI